MLFQDSTNSQAKLKLGILGFAGSGKTYTATIVMCGLIAYMRKHKIEGADKPLYFLDTETGADWIAPLVRKSDIQLRTFKSRAFKDLVPAVREAEANGCGLIIDSITHFWKEFVETYQRRKNRARLEFQDWNFLKPEWGKFTDAYVNSNLHIAMCGRAGFEYDYFTDDDGKKNLEKTGVKMKAESEMGYEPSLLVMMERETNPMTKQVTRTAYVLKDRSTRIDGKQFHNPTFKDFLPHMEFLNLRGDHMGVDLSRDSADMIMANGAPDRPSWKYEAEQKEIILEKIQALFAEQGLSSQSAKGKREIIALLKKHFNTTSWKELEGYHLHALRVGLAALEDDFRSEDVMEEDTGEVWHKIDQRAVFKVDPVEGSPVVRVRPNGLPLIDVPTRSRAFKEMLADAEDMHACFAVYEEHVKPLWDKMTNEERAVFERIMEARERELGERDVLT